MSARIFFLVFCMSVCGLPAQDLVIKGARVLTGKSWKARRANILVKDGRIAKVGRLGKVDPTLPVIKAVGRIVMPGFIEAHTSRGMRTQNERMSIVPFVTVLDIINPADVFFEDSLRDGHLTLQVMPGNNTVIGGMGVIVHPFGLTVKDMTVVEEAGLKISLIPASGNRAAHLAQLRAALDRARDRLDRLEKEGRLEDESKLSGNWDVDLEALEVERKERQMLRLLKEEVRAWFACGTPGDVLAALRLMQDYGIKGRLLCGPGTWRAARMLGKRKIPVVLSPTLEIEERDPETGKIVRRIIPKIFHDAGVEFAMTANHSSDGGLGQRYLWYQAAAMVRYGVPRETALAAVTSVPARLIGLGDRKGTIEPGKDADLLILTEPPLSGRAWVDLAIIGGRVAYNRKHDPRLAEVFGAGSR